SAARLCPPSCRLGTPQEGDLEDQLAVVQQPLVELLGKGGVGEVRAAYDQRLDRSVAVKLLMPRTAVSKMPRRLDPHTPVVARFTREARLMASWSIRTYLSYMMPEPIERVGSV
ncbi:hypothetical protein AB0911_35840, partial [Streptomyces nigra]